MDARTVEVLDPKKKKAYKKMMKRYKKLFKKNAKELAPWDWSFGLSLFIDFLNWMHDYYKLGYNVWAMDVTDPKEAIHTEKTREESLKETLMWYNRWMNVDDDYIKVVYSKEEVDHYLKLGFHLQKDAFLNENWHYLTLYEKQSDNTDALIKATKDYKHKFFESLEKNLEEWWD